MDTGPKYVFLAIVALVAGVLAAIAISNRRDSPAEPTIQGAGSTFAYPLIVQWSSLYERAEKGGKIGYRSIGSGTGVRLLLEKKVDFACSEAPLTDEQLAKVRESGAEALHIPLILGAVVPVYNVGTATSSLRFTGSMLADIYLGKIKKWNDKELSDLNPGINLPDQAITVIHRSDSSGTSHIWTDFLSKTSTEWQRTVGGGTEPKWPTGLAEAGNEGVAEKVQKTPGSIGYVELTYAYRLDLAYGLVQNREKEFVKASLPSVIKAAENALVEIPADLRFSLTFAPGKGSYPLAGVTWAIVLSPEPFELRRDLVNFLTWTVTDGQDHVSDLLYARLPDGLVERSKR